MQDKKKLCLTKGYISYDLKKRYIQKKKLAGIKSMKNMNTNHISEFDVIVSKS